MGSPQPTSFVSRNHSSLDKTWPPSKLWGHMGEITRHPHKRPKTYGQNKKF
jgi:hypothetical protein